MGTSISTAASHSQANAWMKSFQLVQFNNPYAENVFTAALQRKNFVMHDCDTYRLNVNGFSDCTICWPFIICLGYAICITVQRYATTIWLYRVQTSTNSDTSTEFVRNKRMLRHKLCLRLSRSVYKHRTSN